jgi:hypothetical protein
MEQRVFFFYKLHNNKWFHVMNHSLDVIKTTEQEEKRKIEKYGECFYEKGKSKEGIGNKNRDIGKK